MSKKKGKSKGEGGSEASPTGTTTRKPRVVKSFVERLIDKAQNIYTKASEVAQAAEKRGVPAATVHIAKEFVGLASHYRDTVVALRTSGWTPLTKAISIVIEVGSKVAIATESLATYSYIPGVTDGTAKLVVSAVIQQGKRVQALVTTEDGQPCGYIPRSHLVLR